jgi:hypothetical protein
MLNRHEAGATVIGFFYDSLDALVTARVGGENKIVRTHDPDQGRGRY